LSRIVLTVLLAFLPSLALGGEVVSLFDGGDLSAWESVSGDEPTWQVTDDYFEVKPGSGDIRTKASFGDFWLHLEFWLPSLPHRTGQDRANSGVFLHDLYEVQILDSYHNPTFAAGSCGSLYKLIEAKSGAVLPPEHWQKLDIKFRYPRADAMGLVLTPGRISVLLNDIEVIVDQPFIRPTGSRGRRPIVDSGPISLQDHGSGVRYRNVWIRSLNP
jgi:hypothetical protein